jgi:uncharacterized membrane protein
MSFSRSLRSYFFRGLAVLLPTILTIWMFVWGYTFIKENISVYINRGLVRLTMLVKGLEWNDPSNEAMRLVWRDFWIEGWGSIAGFLIALIGVCIVGALLASVVGKTLWRMTEKFIMNTPFLRRVYPYIKQITDFLLTQEEQKKLFSRVVAVEYPRKGIWSIGFVTGSGIQRVVDNVKKEFLTVLIPTSPTPFTGFVIMVPKKQTIEMDMTVEEALRFTVSAGVIAPGSEHIAVLPKAVAENTEE